MKTQPLIRECTTGLSPDGLAGRLRDEKGVMVLRSALFESQSARYSLVTARPFLQFRSWASRCELASQGETVVQFGNPWHVLDGLMSRYELLDEIDFPFPLGGCFGYWGYDLKNFVEPKLTRNAMHDLELPDCQVGFYSSVVVFDHELRKTWIVSVGLREDGSRDLRRAQEELDWWRTRLTAGAGIESPEAPCCLERSVSYRSNMDRAGFEERVRKAQEYIRTGHIYQVNLSQRIQAEVGKDSWEFFQTWLGLSPAPYAAWMDAGDFQIASTSPELFLRMSGSHIRTRPIKGTRPRSADATRDAQLSYELQTSAKEMAELVMITDLLRNDLGRVCEYGTVLVPELMRLERYPQVQHLVSTVEGQLREHETHFSALAQCFPGGSITGAPKIRAMDIIDELEPVTRGPYTGCLGYMGFNRESQFSILIRMAVCQGGQGYFHAGAGIVADSIPEAEYDETMDKAAGFLAALRHSTRFPVTRRPS